MKGLIALVLLFSTAVVAEDTIPWFEQQTALTNAHKKLLQNDLDGAFKGIVQVWQQSPDEHVAKHLDKFFVKSLEKDCGQSLQKKPLPEWLDELVVRRQIIQSPGRQSSSVIIDLSSRTEIDSIGFTRWPQSKVSSDTEFERLSNNDQNEFVFQKRYSLNSRLSSGLFQVTVKPTKGEPWKSWIVMAEPQSKEILRWQAKGAWKVEKTGLLNRHCPLPIMNISVFDYLDGQYQKIWNQEYESDYPTQVPLRDLEPDRYVLAVSITHKRWQGAISIEDQQVISKTYDISID